LGGFRFEKQAPSCNEPTVGAQTMNVDLIARQVTQ
jgi:hypothetical protein